MRQDLIEAVELEFMEACGNTRPIPISALDTLQAVIRSRPELTRDERYEVADFGLEFIAVENYLARHPEC